MIETNAQPIVIDVPHVAVPHLDHYFGAWAIYEDVFRGLSQRVAAMDLSAHVANQQAMAAAGPSYDYQVISGGIAVFALSGPMMKHAPSMSGGTSTVHMRRQVRGALTDDRVRGALLRIDSPGGTVAGTQELAEDLAAFAARKPLIARIEDVGASAAYWVAAQAHEIHVNATGLVGSIGTMFVVHDVSAMASELGVKVIVVKSDGAEMKGAGVPGTEITEAQLAEWQNMVNALNEHFLAGIAAGRGLSVAAVRKLADGRVHVGAEAVRVKLADAVMTIDESLTALADRVEASDNRRRAAASNSHVEVTTMSGNANEATAAAATANEPRAATLAEIEAAMPKAPDAFKLDCVRRNLSMEQTRAAWADHLAAENAKLTAQLEDERAAQTVAGGEAIGTGKAQAAESGFDGDPLTAFDEAVEAAMAKQRLPRHKATRKVCLDNPELHAAYVAAHNEKFAGVV